jgi:transcription-repair coupling factor (superfamily II helicase)
MVQGFSFNPDTTWQQELEASFPYIETEDQTRALVEVKNDMQSDQPMDRLICGDVGYGKTEVALRAAFKAVLDGKQVAVLVPTTVLAQQHFNTFRQRLAAFPVVIEMLSRFRTPQQQRDILSHLSSGRIDILIGTHRLFSSDVEFKDLGLLIIDEEQRFGVTHKETLKKMRTEVDVLTLTATPIPRTLYLALSGIRDISTINTPPEERLPIVTHVGPYSTRLIRQAILRELERGGQVFFVHNRVQTIGAMKSHLNHLVPEAHISIAHGQMPELELSKRMEQFTEGEVDVLLSTSIIESGLDIPNANTLIVDRADTFGLAQLYQLRGRVGRGAQRAYAYFFRHNRKTPTPEGRQRLETIAESTQLGAGFSIAMRDLEIRGTGDILGTRQHGHVAAVGFYLYTRMLAEAVKRLHLGQDIPAPILSSTGYPSFSFVNVDLPMAISLPVDYVPDKNVRLGLYRRMADLRTLEEVEALIEEFNDRFGSPPETVHNLFYQLKIKLLSERDGLSSLTVENGQLVMRFPGDEIPASLPDLGPKVRIGKTALWMPYKSLPDWQNELVNVLLALQSNNVNVN